MGSPPFPGAAASRPRPLLFYANLHPLPPGVRLNATFGAFDRPPDTYRLAGSIRSLPNHASEEAMLALPPVDGLHLVFDPCRAWLAFSAFLCLEGLFEPTVADGVVLD